MGQREVGRLKLRGWPAAGGDNGLLVREVGGDGGHMGNVHQAASHTGLVNAAWSICGAAHRHHAKG